MRALRGVFWTATLAACVFTVGFDADAQRVTPGPDEMLKVGQVIVLSDVTGSTGKNGIFETEKGLVNNFVSMMPDMLYRSGFSSFAGVSSSEWTHVGLRDGALAYVTEAAQTYEYIGYSTPLQGALETVGPEFNPNAGPAALVVFSDGRSRPHKHILAACGAINDAMNGNLCIYTVNVGSDEDGKMLLEHMASVTGCGAALQAEDLQSPAAMEAFVRQVFFGPARRTVVLGAEVLFDLDKAVLKPEGKRAIDGLVADMKASPNERVTVEGHTCDLGTEAYNMNLSQRRADAVKLYMVEQGVAASRINTQGYGESRPAVPNSSESNRKMNRRAEFKFSTMR